MAALRSKVPSIGSEEWVESERQLAAQYIEQDLEDFGFSVRNELEWLNEHMNDIFNGDQINVINVFKTPGKLRGKTPRTARKKENRPPLTDVFAPNPQVAPASSHRPQSQKAHAHFKVAEDAAEIGSSPVRRQLFSTGKGKENIDSGYHGIDEDEMVIERQHASTKASHWSHASQPSTQDTVPDTQSTEVFTQEATQSSQPTQYSHAPSIDDRRTTDESFVSANEAFASKQASRENLREHDNATIPDEKMDLVEDAPAQAETRPVEDNRVISEQYSMSAETASVMDTVIHREVEVADHMEIDDVRSPSDGSSPIKPLVRKSSLTFTSLPGREPLLGKKSMGNRVSRTSHVDPAKARNSHLGRFTGGKSLGGSQHAQALDIHNDDAMELDDERPVLRREESETTRNHNKTSTQRLHERINMLGQSKERESTKPIATSSQPTYPQLPVKEAEKPPKITVLPRKSNSPQKEMPKAPQPQITQEEDVDIEEDDDDSWIAPMKTGPSTTNTSRPPLFKSHSADDHGKFSHKKSASASDGDETVIHHPPTHAKTISVSNPDLSTVLQSTTPIGSPAGRKYIDGPLSASKSKLYSAIRAAKEKFIGSSATSAQAKLDALSEGAARPRLQPQPSLEQIFSPKRNEQTGPSFFEKIRSPSKESQKKSAMPGSPVKDEGRRTRSSSEREAKVKDCEAKGKQRVEDDFEKMRDKERQKAAAQFQKSKSAAMKTPVSAPQPPPKSAAANGIDPTSSHDERAASVDDMPPPPPPKSLLPSAPGQKLIAPRRIGKAPSKETLPKAKPAVIRVNLANNRFGQSNNSMAPPPPPKQPEVATKSSNETLNRSTSSQPPAAPRMNRALAAAANKKKEEERKALEKEQKRREIEQKRAQKLEDERRERDRKAAEQRQVLEEAKKAKAAQRQAAEAKQKQQASRPDSRHGNGNLANALQHEKTQAQAHPRADLGTARPVGRMQTVQDANRPIAVPQVNPAKPAKRIFQPDDEEPVQRSAVQRAGPSFQQLDAKRRKTIEEDEEPEKNRPSVKAPPIRHSNMRKEAQNRFPSGYVQAPSATSMFFRQANAQYRAQEQAKEAPGSTMSKFANGKIPFAEAPNPPAAAAAAALHAQQYKTPARTAPGTAPTTVAKSSPHYPNGENIQLPEIMTDSEDDDSENEFQAPSWTNTPDLREALERQQLTDPLAVFGPIPALNMEQVFPHKERHKRFRERTSSAYWTNDQVTEEERRRDREARERLVRDGAWRFHPSTPGGI